LWFPLTLLLIVLAGLVLAATPTAAAPLAGPGGGWVKANVVGGGCDSQGHCSSEATPGSPTLYEYKPDRESVGRNYKVGSNLAQRAGVDALGLRQIHRPWRNRQDADD
jgi:hypothetical protein